MKNRGWRRFAAAAAALTVLLFPVHAADESAESETKAPEQTSGIVGDGLHILTSDEVGIRNTTGNGILYSVNDDETVTVHGYNDTQRTLSVPAVIDGKPVTGIAATAFYGNRYLVSLTLPDSVVKLGEDAFSSMEKLRRVTLPQGLTEIPERCFLNSAQLRQVELPQELETIGARAFEGCTRLGTLNVPQSVSEIGEDAFSGCENLIFECGDNAYAKEYAASHALVTRFADSNTAVMLKAGALTVVFGAAALLGARLYRRNRAKKNSVKNENN